MDYSLIKNWNGYTLNYLYKQNLKMYILAVVIVAMVIIEGTNVMITNILNKFFPEEVALLEID